MAFSPSRLWQLKRWEQLTSRECASLSLNPSKKLSTLSITAFWIRFSISSESDSFDKFLLKDPDTRTDSSRFGHFSDIANCSGTANDDPPGVITFLFRSIVAKGVLHGVHFGVLKCVLPGVLNWTWTNAGFNGVLNDDWTFVLIALAFDANCNAADVVGMLWTSAFTQQIRTVKLLPESESIGFTRQKTSLKKTRDNVQY